METKWKDGWKMTGGLVEDFAGDQEVILETSIE